MAATPETPGGRRWPLFNPAATTLLRVAIAAACLFLTLTGTIAYAYYHSSYWDRRGIAPAEPVLFSHRHHVGELRLDCRYCHSTVETDTFAGLPPTQTCMNCHSQIFTDTAMLRPVVESAVSGRPIRWPNVTQLPEFVYFAHSIHIAKGVGCTSCHGAIGTMAVTAKGEPLSMRWCLNCHRDPAPRLRAGADIFSAAVPAEFVNPHGAELFRRYGIDTVHLTNCSTCHR